MSAGTVKTAAALHAASTAFLASDDEFEQAFRTAGVSAHYLGRYYLRVLEHASSSKGSKELIVNPSEELVTLEHVMPKAREPHWKHITQEQHRTYFKRLGNLALLDKTLNEYAGNLSFTEKSKAFAKSQIALTRDIAASTIWDAKAVESRQEKLAKLAVQAWPLRPK